MNYLWYLLGYPVQEIVPTNLTMRMRHLTLDKIKKKDYFLSKPDRMDCQSPKPVKRVPKNLIK